MTHILQTNDLTDEDDKMKIYKNFVAYVTNGCSTSSLID